MKKLLLLTFMLVVLLLALLGTKSGKALYEITPDTTFTLGEGIDFATRVLADPWDMSNFTDISQWLNHSPSNNLADIQVYDGVFSARSLSSYSEFYPLYPGYEPGLNSGKIGARFPIDSNAYACFYMAMYTDWNVSTAHNYYTVFWAPDRYISTWTENNPVWGTAGGNELRRDQWTLYRINLKTHPYIINKPWTSQQYWQAFRITPSLVANTQFYVDWVRLTNCQPVYANLSGLSPGTYTMWLGTGSPERQILVINSFSPKLDGSYAWDVQGLPAGNYTYYVKTVGGNTVQQGQLNIIGSPIVTFTSPSPYSGPDYANAQGNPWDMDPSDVTRIDCASYSFTNGILSLDTPSRACAGPGANEADPHIYLNTVDHGNLSSYRYLSFPSRTDGAWSVPDLGMIVRLIWRLNRPGEDCYYVSRAIALDIGWQTYTVDLYDPLNGIPEEKTPADCPLVSWRDQAAVGPVVGFRLDPNENITGGNMHQEFDWIRLTKVEQVSQGNPVKIRVLLNKQPSEVTLHFYYTTDLSQQTQNLASTYPTTIFAAPNIQYLPIVFAVDPNYDPFVDDIPADVTYLWNTRGVTPGEYYSCAQASDGYNQATYCSQVPVQINP